MPAKKDSWAALEAALGVPSTERYVLRLYVAGGTPQSILALHNLKALCGSHLKGRYELDVIDVYQEPARAAEAQIIAVPTLLKLLPLPTRRLVGDLSDTPRVLHGLNLPHGAIVDAPKAAKPAR